MLYHQVALMNYLAMLKGHKLFAQSASVLRPNEMELPVVDNKPAVVPAIKVSYFHPTLAMMTS